MFMSIQDLVIGFILFTLALKVAVSLEYGECNISRFQFNHDEKVFGRYSNPHQDTVEKGLLLRRYCENMR